MHIFINLKMGTVIIIMWKEQDLIRLCLTTRYGMKFFFKYHFHVVK